VQTAHGPQLFVDVVVFGILTREEDGNSITMRLPLIIGYTYDKPTELEMLKSEIMGNPMYDINGKSREWQLDMTRDNNPKIFKAMLKWDVMGAKYPLENDDEV
jgi:hypothetical protein